MGPIGFLIKQVEELGLGINSDFIITDDKGIVIDIFNTPWNHLKKMCFDTAIRARDARISKHRIFCWEH